MPPRRVRANIESPFQDGGLAGRVDRPDASPGAIVRFQKEEAAEVAAHETAVENRIIGTRQGRPTAVVAVGEEHVLVGEANGDTVGFDAQRR